MENRTEKLRAGQIVRVRAMGDDDTHWAIGEVVLASSSKGQREKREQSVALRIEGMVRAGDGWIAGVLPLLIDYDRGSVMGLTGDEYEIEVRGQA